ncbi:Filamin/ABP280 repeat family protein [Babesia bovis T2Bo]|uniref:Uncharacterized protein n=1 Tax=Babesia bovis TaxID=5865 RepID=A7ASB1_BABBO|nr:Filamin/ABP280 repeat family protein [Babesia bovis T2Bo]EDO07430.1 Filamin/ABP280 repeat family protein [Babesia bovis T2Bo]|eukprot:XP_001610998.1 hypothetical protein [Babesia bovis T2Bo]
MNLTKPAGLYARTINVVPRPDTTYVEGDGINGGECGKWLKFIVKKHGSLARGVVRLNLDYAEDACFKSSVFINHNADERDLQRDAPSCHNKRLANNSVSDALENNFLWDVCVVDGQTYNVRYRVTRQGTFLLHVTLDGNPIPGSPFKIYISDAPPHVPACRVYGKNTESCYAIPFVPEIIEAIFPNAYRTPDNGTLEVTGKSPRSNKAINSPSLRNKGQKNVSPRISSSRNGTPREVNTYPNINNAEEQRVKDLISIAYNDQQQDPMNWDYDPELGLGAAVSDENPISPKNRSARRNISPRSSRKADDNKPTKTRLLNIVDRHSKDYLRNRKKHTMTHLERNMLLNEIEVHLADEHGNTVTHALPYVRAWGENYARVVSVDHRKNGVIKIKYIVIVTREGLPLLKDVQARGIGSVLPSSLQVGQVPCKIYVEINGKPLFGSPFKPQVVNVEDLERYYKLKLGTVESIVHKFTVLVNNHDFDGCAELYNSIESSEAKAKLGGILVNKLTELEKDNIYATSEIRLVESLKLQSLGRLLGLVHNQYKKMLTYKTSSILHCIRELNDYEKVDPTGDQSNEGSKSFNNLGDVILNYRLIGDELRKLHRYELADRFDQINDQICDEIDLQMWSSIIGQKEKRVQKLRSEVETTVERLSSFKDTIESRYSSYTRKDLNDLKHIPGFAKERSIQTEPVDMITSRLSHLIKGRCVPSQGNTNIDSIVESTWRKCNNYDIQATVSKVLKSSIRLKNCISELFMYYSTPHDLGERTVLGVRRASMELFVLESTLNNYLCANVKKLEWLFERFSIELRDKDGKIMPRIIPEHMWCAYLREIGYLNLLYTIAESGDRELLRDSQHPSRLVAFHHLCKEHLIPLYETLFTTKPDFQKCLKFPSNHEIGTGKKTKVLKKTVGGPSEQYFNSRQDILNYFNVRALEHVLDVFDIDVLHRIFKHYSRLSMFGRKQLTKNWFSENATISTATFVIFARDFQIIPGHMDGERVHSIARNVASRGQAGANKLGFRDFLNAISRTIARAVLASTLAKHDDYEVAREKISDTVDIVPRCVQSRQSVKSDIEMMVKTLGLCDDQFVRYTIDALYGAEAVEYIDGVLD